MGHFHYGLQVRLYTDDKFFGKGTATLLELVAERGSVSAAAKEMGIAYSKTYKMIKTAEKAMGFRLVQAQIGGADGGSSKLTPECVAFLEKYNIFYDALDAFAKAKFCEVFDD